MKFSTLLLILSGSLLLNINASAAPSASPLPVFTAKTLKTYNGKNKQPAYVALNGLVYDVSKVPQWQGGRHYAGMVAGTDLSGHIQDSPHGPNIVKQLKLKPIGTYQ